MIKFVVIALFFCVLALGIITMFDDKIQGNKIERKVKYRDDEYYNNIIYDNDNYLTRERNHKK